MSHVRNCMSPQSLTNGVVQVRYTRAHIRKAREILRPEDVQKTLIGLTQEDLRQVHPRHTTDRTELAYQLAGAILLGPLLGFWCNTHAVIEGSRLVLSRVIQNWSDFGFSIDNHHFGRAISCPHCAHGNFCSNLSSCALRSSDD